MAHGTKNLVGFALAGLALAALAMPGQAEPYYKGKTITMIVGQTAGSGPDTQARFNARYMERVIEGNPTVIVRNVPGAQFQRAQSIVHRAAPDVFGFAGMIPTPGFTRSSQSRIPFGFPFRTRNTIVDV